MSRINFQSSKQQFIEFHSELKTQFLKLYNVPFIDDDFIQMTSLLKLAGVCEFTLDSFYKGNGQFDFKQYAEFIRLSQNTIISLHSDISRLA